MATKKLIEVALPLDKINAASAREKSIRHGHPSTLHLWWARRPLAAARAVIWSSLVDDPSSHPELFPTEEDQNRERQRLFKILEDLVIWENSNNQDVLNAAKAEIIKSTNGNPPALLDPFAGGGAIPLEAQRLGLEAHAHDLNPVAVMINKAMIEIPPRFANMSPVNPDDKVSRQADTWKGAQGLAADILYYGNKIKERAYAKIGLHYPKIQLPKEYGDYKADVIAWIWARTVKCSNPACQREMPLASTFILSKKKGNEAWVEPITSSEVIKFKVHKGKCPKEKETLKQGRSALFKCPYCGEVTTDQYVKKQGKDGKIGKRMMAIVADGPKGRVYLDSNLEHENAAKIEKTLCYPDGKIPSNPRWFSPPAFGMTHYSDVFTKRQLLALSTLCSELSDFREIIERDAVKAGFKDDHLSLDNNGQGARAYSETISVYLAFAIDRLANRCSMQCVWNRIGQKIEQTFGRQAMAMVWDFAESNVFGSATGSWMGSLEWIPKCVELFPADAFSEASQFNAQEDCLLRNILVSTDPPYYDNIGYADLSDYFYIWMRYALKDIYPNLFSTMLVPKSEELIADQYRHENAKKAKDFFENGMLTAFKQFRTYSSNDFPVTVFYAYKQSETETSTNNTSSSGWETMLSAIINAGFIITGTWPMRTERETGLKAYVNALASSIVLVCRKRLENAPQTTRRNLINALRRELRPALKQLQESNIAPVDLAQSAIGPGMGVFSRYSKVLEADGTPMSVRSALQIINEEVDLYFNEQVSDLDAMSRFCVDLFTQNAFNDMKFGEADVLARAKGTSVAALASHNVVYAKAGTVHLLERTELPEKIDENESCIWLLTQQLTQAMATGGVEACAKAVFTMFGSNAERAKDLAYRLYTIAEQKKWASEAFAYNALVVAWPDIQSRAAMMQREKPEQLDIFKMGLLDS